MKAPPYSPDPASSAAQAASLSTAPGSSEALASRIDHTFLKPEATEADIARVCEEARTYRFATVCVRPNFVALAARLLTGSETLPIAVIDFPKGEASPEQKASETRKAIADGAKEIDMVLNFSALKARDYSTVLEGIRAVVNAARPVPVKVILETGALSEDEKVIGCALSQAAGAAFVKTSTGFGPGGATLEDVALMRRIVGPEVKVKASGGIRTREDALKMIEAGADRLGTSAGITIVTGAARSAGSSRSEGSEKSKDY